MLSDAPLLASPSGGDLKVVSPFDLWNKTRAFRAVGAFWGWDQLHGNDFEFLSASRRCGRPDRGEHGYGRRTGFG